MVTIKEAAENAMRFALETMGSQRAGQVRLEEVTSETSSGNDYWLIALSMIDLDDPGNAGLIAYPGPRLVAIPHLLVRSAI
jgi:hypothetical protein